MPIYEYRCESCGLQKEFLQKAGAAPLTDCPECKQPTLKKLLSAAGFQLKGSGWYATDFKSKGGAPASKETSSEKGNTSDKTDATENKTEKKSEKAESASSSDSKPTQSACGAGTCPACS